MEIGWIIIYDNSLLFCCYLCSKPLQTVSTLLHKIFATCLFHNVEVHIFGDNYNFLEKICILNRSNFAFLSETIYFLGECYLKELLDSTKKTFPLTKLHELVLKKH